MNTSSDKIPTQNLINIGSVNDLNFTTTNKIDKPLLRVTSPQDLYGVTSTQDLYGVTSTQNLYGVTGGQILSKLYLDVEVHNALSPFNLTYDSDEYNIQSSVNLSPDSNDYYTSISPMINYIPTPVLTDTSKSNLKINNISQSPITSPFVLFESDDMDKSINVQPIFSPIPNPISSIDNSKKPKELSNNNKISLTGPLPVEHLPTFSLKKNINILSASNATLENQLKNKDRNIREIATKILEKRIITMQGKCPHDIVETLKIRTFQLDATSMSFFLQTSGIYDHNFQDGVGCLIDALISDEAIVPDLRFRRWITNINKIGDQSAESIAFKLKNNSDPLYVIKVTADIERDHLCHEALVGIGAINKLRSKIPTFMHTYGAFMCTPPIFEENGKVACWCPARTNEITYLVLENIESGVPLSLLMPTINESEFLQIYLQILNGLNLAYKHFDYTHYDLHPYNVLIQVLDYYVSVPFYNPSGSLSYIITRHLARIIDHGVSHIYLQGQHFGIYGLESSGIDPESSFPMHDAYKLLLFCYYDSAYQIENDSILSIKSSNQLTLLINGIYDFFKENKTANERIRERIKNPFTDFFQPSNKFKLLKHDDLINFILSKYTLNFLTKDHPNNVISTICQDTCVDWNNFTKTIFDCTRLPENLEDYCQANIAIEKLSMDSNRNKLRRWIQQFNIELAYETEKKFQIDELNQIINDINDISLNPNVDLKVYEENLRKLIKIRSRLQNIQVWVTAVVCAFNLKHKINYVSDDIIQIVNGINKIKFEFKKYLIIIKDNTNNIQTNKNIFFLQKILLSSKIKKNSI